MKNIVVKRKKLTVSQVFYGWMVVLFPFLGFLVTLIFSQYYGVNLIVILLAVLMYMLSIIGIEIGFHRYLSHCSFRTNEIMRALWAILGSMAGQGPPIYWVATHRRHHQYSDLPGDAHSPNLHGKSLAGKLKGLWHAHLGWVFDLELTNTLFFAKDLLKDPLISKINRYYILWVLLGLALPAFLGGVLTQSWLGFWSGFLWGGLTRLFLSQNMIYAVNSICHVSGNRPFKTTDHSRNNVWLAIPSLGAAWHNNHHAFPNSAVNGLEWWQIDLCSWVLRFLEMITLVWDIKTPSHEMISSKKSTSLSKICLE